MRRSDSSVAVNQQRLIYASTLNKPNSLFASRPGKPDDFRVSNPVTDGDAFEFAIFDQQITRINWLKSMPGGLLIGTDSGVVQLTGGASSPSNPAAVSATNAVIVPQSYYGTDDMPPIVIDYDVLFVQKEARLLGSWYGSSRPRLDFHRFIEMTLAGKLKVNEMITRTYSLDQINEAYDSLGRGEVARSVITFPV